VLESSPSGPTAFWSLRDHVSNDNALVVAQHADVSLRNEIGMTLLHAAVAKLRLDGKHDVIATLLSRGVDVSARDFEGSTARDYIIIHRVRIFIPILVILFLGPETGPQALPTLLLFFFLGLLLVLRLLHFTTDRRQSDVKLLIHIADNVLENRTVSDFQVES